MREIKFRVWFHNPENIKEGEWIELEENYEEKESVIGLGITLFQHTNDIKYCQYTGLKDKNGKEIYEGDILTYEATGAKFECYWNPVGFWDDWDYLKLYKVIGNIYENPELLETNK